MSDSQSKWTRRMTNLFLAVVALVVIVASVVTVAGMRQQTESQDRFQQCLTAILFLPIEDRKQLTDSKIERACLIDAGKVRDIRNKLTAP